MSVDEDGFWLKNIRNLERGTTFDLAYGFSIGVLHKIHQYLRHGKSKIDEFNYFSGLCKATRNSMS